MLFNHAPQPYSLTMLLNLNYALIVLQLCPNHAFLCWIE